MQGQDGEGGTKPQWRGGGGVKTTEKAMIAYHGKEAEKESILAQLRAHAAADELVKGLYWEDGKGCAVGCTVHSGKHVEYETRFGIPEMLARLEDAIFEGLPSARAKKWPVRFMSAIRPGSDLSRVGWQFLHWLLTDEKVNPGINHPLVRDAVKQCADVLAPMAKGKPVDKDAAWSAAESARSAAESAESARSAAESARSAAWSARSAAWSAAESARSAAESAESARSAAESARSAARSAAESAESARSAARSAAESAESAESAVYVLMADKLIFLLESAP